MVVSCNRTADTVRSDHFFRSCVSHHLIYICICLTSCVFFSLNIRSSAPHLLREVFLPSLCTLAMLAPWLQGFPMCIYCIFIGTEHYFLSAYQQPPCTPPANLPGTALGFQGTTGPGCSHSDLDPHILSFILKKFPRSLDLCPADLCFFHNTHFLLLFFFLFFFLFFLPSFTANPLPWLSASLFLVSALLWCFTERSLLSDSESLAAPCWLFFFFFFFCQEQQKITCSSTPLFYSYQVCITLVMRCELQRVGCHKSHMLVSYSTMLHVAKSSRRTLSHVCDFCNNTQVKKDKRSTQVGSCCSGMPPPS